MAVVRYSLVAHDWLNLEYIINDLTRRVVNQGVSPTSIPTFAGVTITGLSGTTITTESVETSIEELDAAIDGLTGAFLPLDGSVPMEGDLDMDGYDISNVGTITAEQLTSTDDASITGTVRTTQLYVWPDSLGVSDDGEIYVFSEGSLNHLYLSATDAGVSTISSVEQLYFKSADNDFTFMEYLYGDYLRINVDGTHPKITAYSGLIDFDDEDLVTTGTVDLSAGNLLIEDYGTVRPETNEDGHVGVAQIDGDGRLYFTVEGLRYYVTGTIDTVGTPMGMLLVWTYSS